MSKTLKFSETYDILEANNLPELSHLLAKVYKKNPFENGTQARYMWKEQCSLNIPILYLASILLNSYMKKYNYTKCVFTARDCCLWYKIYSAMYPNADVVYFRCSRNMFKVGTVYDRPEYKKYVKDTFTNDAIYIDIHGTGAHMIDYFKSNSIKIPPCFFLSMGTNTYSELDEKCYEHYKKGKLYTIVFDAHGSPIEMLNYDLCGTLEDYKSSGPQFAKMEYSYETVEPYHQCVKYFISKVDKINSVISKKKATDIIRYLFKNISEIDQKPVISSKVEHLKKHPHPLFEN